MTRDNEIRQAAEEGARCWEKAAFETGVMCADKHPISPWISVEDKLPSYDDGEVLVHARAGDRDEVFISFLVKTNSLYWHGDRNGFAIFEEGSLEVFHWCYLPELPKEEKEEWVENDD